MRYPFHLLGLLLLAIVSQNLVFSLEKSPRSLASDPLIASVGGYEDSQVNDSASPPKGGDRR
jgi:hypothetical protein